VEDATADVFPTSARILPDKIAVKGLCLRLRLRLQPTRTPQATSSYAESLRPPYDVQAGDRDSGEAGKPRKWTWMT
jgi:hypothetical protein